ncbi:excalibur calcium-binding domain-containing protein [Chengkuizengella sp. SCS-71B]|uniref:excalibur calcium-binding domain-containing protein n=1 Tax=Chengkuizengella sp. SCS-71B TaxID=3115290 RepID=UPI0032C23C56
MLFVIEEKELGSVQVANNEESTIDIPYANCTLAREAGVTPLHAGDLGYSTKLDRDGDGVACE